VLLLCSGIDEKFEHAQVLREHYVFLLDALDAKHSGLVRRLQQTEVLSKDEARSVNSEVLPMRQNEKLLSILSGKIKEQFDKFLEVLDKTGYLSEDFNRPRYSAKTRRGPSTPRCYR